MQPLKSNSFKQKKIAHPCSYGIQGKIICENSSVGRARPCQGRGREFESRFSLQIKFLPGWWNGRHVGLKIQWPLWLWGFKSPSGYIARIAQLVEHDLAKVGVASSSLVSRLKKPRYEKYRGFFIALKKPPLRTEVA